MDHLDLALNSQQEAVYSSASDESGGEMSERVSTLASSIYAEFERMIQGYGPSVVENLMPMVINVLEQLDSSYSEGNEQSVELELLAEDNEQLITQYEREKQLRKLAEAKYLEHEDSREQDRQDLQNVIEQLEHAKKQAENKIKQIQDQVDRSDDRYNEQKKEYDILHKRHTEMLHAYMERIEFASKMSPSPAASETNNSGENFFRKQISMPGSGLISASHPNLLMASTGGNMMKSASSSSLYVDKQSDYIENRNDLSFDDELSHENQLAERTGVSTPKNLKRSSAVTSDAVRASMEQLDIQPSEKHLSSDTLSQARDLQLDNIENKHNTTEGQEASLFLSPEAQAILQSTPELMKTHSRLQGTVLSTTSDDPTLDAQHALKQQQHDLSLYAEMYTLDSDGNQGYSDIGNVEQKGLKEFDHLLKENKDLLDVRNKLQTQKNELIQRMDQLSSDKEIQEEEINGLQTTKTRMKLKISELEQTLKKVRLENEKAQLTLKNKVAEERISSANRKRFTRVEMAKVLMERNQYKERLMELQEAVRWTEMIRASKENHMNALQQKKKSSIWRLFSNLFAGTSTSATTSPSKKSTQSQQQPINVWYGSQNNSMQRRSTGNINTPSKYTGDTGFEGLTERQRQERKERYKFVKQHINSEGRKQAYGWSLPSNYTGEKGTGPLGVPVPVYCRPLNTDAAMKIWCASGVNLEGGKTADGNFIGLPEDFKSPSSSTVWIGTSTHSCSKVTIIDANNPANALDQFIVSSSHLLCMAAVAGLNMQDKTDGFQRQGSPEHGGSVTGVQAEEESFPDDEVDGSQSLKFTSVLPTMWLGAQSGKVYIHSIIGNWKKCLQSAKLKDSLLSIVHIHDRVLAALADGTVAIFHRKPDGRWDLSNYHLLDLGRPHHSIRCMTPVHDYVWCGYRNKVQVINPISMRIEKSFDAHPRRESQVRQLACIGDGVWVSIRLDSTLRLYNAHTYHHLQDVDIEPYVSKMLGTGKFGFSFVRITALLLTDDRLWVGTGNGIILSVPLVSARPVREGDGERNNVVTEVRKRTGSEASFMPYCAMVHAQLSFHGHRDSVKFFISVTGSSGNIEAAKAYSMAGARPPSPSTLSPKKEVDISAGSLVMSGGEGYIDFRVGDEESAEESIKPAEAPSKLVAVERSHLLVWQVNS